MFRVGHVCSLQLLLELIDETSLASPGFAQDLENGGSASEQ
ncbi:MAG: hypothetical protein QM756_04350 [Polyangiaceae bacterium]